MTEVIWLSRFVVAEAWSVLPAFVVSITLGALVHALQLDGLIRRAVEARVGLAVVLATAVGAFSPLCACTVVPVISGLLHSGVPLAPVMSFWIASPTMDPEKFALTVAMLGWPLAVARLAATLALSLGAGFLTVGLVRAGLLGADVLRRAAASPSSATKGRLPVISGASDAARATSSCCAVGAAAPSTPRASFGQRLANVDWRIAGGEMAVQSWRLGRWLLFAFLLEALIVRYVPQPAIASVLGGGSRFAVVIAALVGIPLYLNNVAALPIVSGLLAQGMQPGAAIAFLIAGPVTTVPAMSAVWGVVTRRVFALYLGVSLLGAVVLGWLTNLVLG
jgi:uncharacterized membrane protein YraQ (UPF0718 family)